SYYTKCRCFPKRKLNMRGEESLITDTEIQSIELVMADDVVLEFLYVLLNTGMRLNELFSLQAVNVEEDLSDLEPHILKPFEILKVKIYGYIRLESQIYKPKRRNIREVGGRL